MDTTISTPAPSSLDLPAWLAPSTPTPSPVPRRSPIVRPHSHYSTPKTADGNPVKQLTLTTFEIVFQTVLEKVANGQTLTSALNEDHRSISHGAFRRWISADPERDRLFKEAMELRAYALEDRLEVIGEGTSSSSSPDAMPEDIARSRLKYDITLKLMEFNNRARYGSKTTVEVNQTISITAALEQAKARVALALVDRVPDDVIASLIAPSPHQSSDQDIVDAE